MFKTFNTYLSDKIDRYIRPKGLRSGLLRSFRVVASAVNGASAIRAANRYATRPSYNYITVAVNNIKRYAPVAGANTTVTASSIAGDNNSAFKYIIDLGVRDITAFMKAAGSPNVLLRNCDFIENNGVYFFKEYPGTAGIHTISNSGDVLVFTVIGGPLRIRHRGLYASFIKHAVNGFIRFCIDFAKGVNTRSIGTPASITSAITGDGVVLANGIVQNIWKESDYLYMLTDTGALHRAAADAVIVKRIKEHVNVGDIWCKKNVEQLLVVPTKNGYDVITQYQVAASVYPDTAASYPDLFINGLTDIDVLRGALQEKGIQTSVVRTPTHAPVDITALQDNMLITGHDIIVQYIS